MNRIPQKGVQPTTTNATVTPVAPQNTGQPLPVSVPLDVLQSIASIAQKQLERRPPKLTLQKKKQGEQHLSEARPMAEIQPLVSKGTEETTIEIAQFVLRRQSDILQSSDPQAMAGLVSLERMLIMFQQAHMMETGTQFARAKT